MTNLSGIDMIALERKRQVRDLGYSKNYDAGFADELVHLAMDNMKEAFDILMVDGSSPRDAVEHLKKSGALMAAAIDSIYTDERKRALVQRVSE